MVNDAFMKILIRERQQEIAESIYRSRMSRSGRRRASEGLRQTIRRLRSLLSWPRRRQAPLPPESAAARNPAAQRPEPVVARGFTNAV